MPKRFLVAIHHPENFDPSEEGAAAHRDIDALNDEMVEAGIRVFVGGLQGPSLAKSIAVDFSGEVAVSDGLYLGTSEHVAGFWVLELPSMDEALEWGKKAAKACRAPVEVRQFN